jgi:hypothetical protein
MHPCLSLSVSVFPAPQDALGAYQKSKGLTSEENFKKRSSLNGPDGADSFREAKSQRPEQMWKDAMLHQQYQQLLAEPTAAFRARRTFVLDGFIPSRRPSVCFAIEVDEEREVEGGFGTQHCGVVAATEPSRVSAA